MNNSIIKLMLFSIFCMFVSWQSVEAYDTTYTHQFINEKAVKEKSSIDLVLKNSLGFDDGIEKAIGKNKIWEWIKDGGRQEDAPRWRTFRHFHDPHIKYVDEDPYEKWVESNKNIVKALEFDDFTVDPAIFNQAVPNTSAPSPVSALWDHNEYRGVTMPADSNTTIGLAEYTNANFWTEDTFPMDKPGDYPHPQLTDTDYYEKLFGHVEQVLAENNEWHGRIYFSKNSDAPGTPFIAADYWHYTLYSSDIPLVGPEFILDDECHKQYAKKLIPRAIGYSGALLDYFFRGKMQVTTLPIFFNNGIYAIQLHIKNITPSLETMTNGNFSLVVRYTPEGGNADGSDDIFVLADEVVSGELPYDGELNTFFFLHALVPRESYDSVKCMLAFKGTLGSEEDAVIGKFFELGEIKFNEDWDNGLNGNYQWTHTTEDDNPDNGTTSNIINTDNNAFLIKENIRYAGYSTPRYNSSYLDFTSNLDTPDGILMTSDTYIQFKVDDLSINVQPPASPGTTTAYQIISLRFNDGHRLIFSQEGQGVNFGSSLEAYYTFDSGFIIVDNIYTMFQNAGIAIPEPFYLKAVSLSQQLWDITESSTEEHRQHMENDFIRIVEENVSE